MRREVATTRGFTTVELLVVMVILVLLGTIFMSSLVGRSRGDAVGNEARKIQALLATARSQSLAENTYYQAVFWLDQPSYWIDEIDQAGQVIRPKIVTPEPVDEMVLIPEILVDSVVHQAGRVTIRFFPQGNSNDASISLVRRGTDATDTSNITTVRLYAPTGRANILKNARP